MAGLAWAGAGAGTVPVPAALTGATLDGHVIGSSPFLDPPSFDAVDGALVCRTALSRGTAPEAIFRLAGSGQAPEAVAAVGDSAAPGARYDRFLRPTACNGLTTFWAGLGSDAGASPPPPSSGIFLGSAGQTQAAALVGDPAPAGGLITALGSDPGLDMAGRLTFLAATDEAAGLVLLRRRIDGVLEQILAAGTVVETGATVIDLLDAQPGCGAPLLARVILDSGGDHVQALLRETGGSWHVVLTSETPLPGGGAIGTPRLPAAALTDGSLVLLADRPDGAGAVLARLDADLSVTALASEGDALADGVLTALEAPTSWDGQRAALLASLQPSLPPASPEREVILATDSGGSLDVVLDTGAAAPGGEPLVDLDVPRGDGRGHLALRARTAVGDTAGLLQMAGGSATWLALAGQEIAPWGRMLAGGLRGSGPALDDNGRALFIATLPPGRDDEALFVASPGEPPSRLLQPGDTLSSGETLLSLEGPPSAGSSGTAWLAARSTGAASRLGYVRARPDEPADMLVAEGDPSPLGGTLRTLGRIVSATPGDRLVFTATLSQASSGSAVLTLGGGDLQVLAATGQAAPGGGVWSAFGFAPAAVGETGAGFLAYTGGSRAGSGIYHVEAAGGPALAVALSGQPAPGGGEFAAFADPVAGGGVLAFLARLGDERIGIFRWDGTSCTLLVIAGDSLPGGGAVTAIAALAVDGSGEVYAALEVSGAPWSAAVYALDGVSGPVLRSGMALPLEDGSTAALADFTTLAAAGSGHLSFGLDLGGWSGGAAVAHAATDSDGDGWGDPVDCAVADAAAWRQPPVATLRLETPAASQSTDLSWLDLSLRAGPGTVHDILGGLASGLRRGGGLQGAACAAAGLAGDGVTLADGLPPSGDAFWYLVRGRNACGAGELGPAAIPRQPAPALCAAP